MTALHFAASSARRDLIHAILAYNPNINCRDSFRKDTYNHKIERTPLHIAAASGNVDALEILLSLPTTDVNASTIVRA